jgi:hypothetical protein
MRRRSNVFDIVPADGGGDGSIHRESCKELNGTRTKIDRLPVVQHGQRGNSMVVRRAGGASRCRPKPEFGVRGYAKYGAQP